MSEEEINDFINSLYKLNWIKILKESIDNRRTSWGENPVTEYRNASDEILMKVVSELRKHHGVKTEIEKLNEKRLKKDD